MVNKILFLITIMLASANAWVQALTIDEAGGWLESAHVKWQPVAGAGSYNVYYSGEGVTNQKIDDQLIRSYGTYFRADVLGLKAGSYTITVKSVISGIEGEAATTGSLTVEAHDRSGFAFSNGRIPGAYKADGTPKDGAVILYITQNTKNTISMSVADANTNPCIGLQAILDGFKKGIDTRPLIVRMVGQITDPTLMYNGDIVIENDNNALGYITIEGVGDDAVADGWGIRLKYATNVEIRNLGTMNCDSGEGDNIGLQQDNYYIWVHNCDFFYGAAGSDADQVKGDGALDSKTSGFVTFSYNHFWDTGKSNLLGNGIENPEYLTYHHNWYDHSDSRHPRIRCHSVHVYNNYYDGNSKYGVGSTNASSVFVEGNYFRNCKYPMLISMQGSDVWNEATQANDYVNMPIFSKENGGVIKAFNNYMTGQKRFAPYGDIAYPNPTVDFDAYVATSKEEQLSSTVVAFKGGSTYNNFDTNSSVMYAYTADSPDDAKANVIKYAGRVNGGDLKYTFNNSADDASSDINAALKAVLTGYVTSMDSIQGDGKAPDDEDPVEPAPGDEIHNFTLSGTTSTFYAITGNLSTSKGTETYAGLTLTQCLKMESATTISFTTTQSATLTLVFNAVFTGKTKIDGTDYIASAGVVTVTIAAGTHTILKGDASNLYYMSVDYPTSAATNNVFSDLKLYPNPFTNGLSVSCDATIVKIEIYSLTGVLLKCIQSNIKTIDLSKLSNGTYLIVVVTEQGLFKQTIVKR